MLLLEDVVSADTRMEVVKNEKTKECPVSDEFRVPETAITVSQDVKTASGTVTGTAEEIRKPVEDKTKPKKIHYLYIKSLKLRSRKNTNI